MMVVLKVDAALNTYALLSQCFVLSKLLHNDSGVTFKDTKNSKKEKETTH